MIPLQMEEVAALYPALSDISHNRGTDRNICTMEDYLLTKPFHQQDTITTGRPTLTGKTTTVNHRVYMSKMTQILYECFDVLVSLLVYAHDPKFFSTAPLSALLS
jgi:hypothetical protein